MTVTDVVELGLGPLVSKVIRSDFLEGDTGTTGLEGEAEVAAGIENPTIDDVGRVLRVAEVEDEVEEGEGRRSSAHDFLTTGGGNGTGGGASASSLAVSDIISS